jgi:polyphosphate kinase
MYRNLSKRVEVVTPVTSQASKEKLWEILDVYLRDKRQAWVLAGDGTYSRLNPDHSDDEIARVGAHEALMQITRRRSNA